MILAIDIGNTNIVIGGIDGERTYFIERVTTVRTGTELEYAIDIKNVLDIYGIAPDEIEGGIVCSVVPQITNVLKTAAQKILRKSVMVVKPGMETGLNILMDFPKQLGSDLVADAVAGITHYPVPQIIFDLGTATTVCVIDEKKNYIGGMIYPGLQVSLDALTAHASQLQGVGLESPGKVIGKNTIDCMKSGILNSNAAAMDGIIGRIEKELGQKTTVLATGGLADKVAPLCEREVILDRDLLLKGMLEIYRRNTKEISDVT
ncbi:MAG: type III pantothenate kinase [Eubacteriales bacterium]|nr:type III pantothenate kinase [Eubacteriales bacterium]